MTAAPRSHPRLGFTLIELLLAIVIFSVVLAAINGVLYGAFRLRQKTTLRLADAAVEQYALDRMRADLGALALPGGTFGGALQTANILTVPVQGTVLLEFNAEVGVPGPLTPWAGIQRVAYLLRDATNQTSLTGRELVRMVQRNPLPPAEVVGETEWLLGDVESVEFGFFDGFSWRTAWDSATEPTVLPRAIRVDILRAAPLPTGDGSSRPADLLPPPPLQLVVPVRLQADTNQTDTATGGNA